MEIIPLEEAIDSTKDKKAMQTVCEGCPFNRPQPNNNENLNDYCSAGRLEKFKENGCEIISAEYDKKKDRNSKIVKNRVCNMLRNDSWAKFKKNNGAKDEELVKIARKEIEIPCTYIVYCPESQEISKEKNEKEKRKKIKEKVRQTAETIKSIDAGRIAPQQVIVINNANIKPYEFITYLRREAEELSITCKWSMEYVSKDSMKGLSDEQSYFACLYLSIKKIKSIYFSVFFSGDVVPENYLYDIDKLINDDMKRVLIITPEDKNSGGSFMQRLVYKQYMGQNIKNEDFLEAIKKEIEGQECQHMIYNLKDIVKTQQ